MRRRKVVILVALVAAIVLAGALGVYFLNSRGGDESTALEPPTERWSNVACTAENVAVTFEGPTEAAAGREVAFTVTLKNQSDEHPCYFDAGWSNVDITVTSGNDTVVSTQECQIGSENKQLLIDRSAEASFTLTWPGGVGDAACGAPDANPSRPGTYVAHLSFKDKTAEDAEAVFVVN